jgi:hypothetical protein
VQVDLTCPTCSSSFQESIAPQPKVVLSPLINPGSLIVCRRLACLPVNVFIHCPCPQPWPCPPWYLRACSRPSFVMNGPITIPTGSFYGRLIHLPRFNHPRLTGPLPRMSQASRATPQHDIKPFFDWAQSPMPSTRCMSTSWIGCHLFCLESCCSVLCPRLPRGGLHS